MTSILYAVSEECHYIGSCQNTGVVEMLQEFQTLYTYGGSRMDC